MTINLHKLAVTSVLALGLGASPALADCHGDWDTNQDPAKLAVTKSGMP